MTSRESGLLGVLVVLVIALVTGCGSADERAIEKMQANDAWAKEECAKTPGCEPTKPALE